MPPELPPGAEAGTSYLVYDGECPFCSAYVRLVRLRESIGKVELLNARQGGELVDYLRGQAIDLDEGMVLLYQGQLYHGDACIHALALLSTPSGIFNRLNVLVFRNARLAAVLYPVLRAGRNLLLRLLGRTKIDAA